MSYLARISARAAGPRANVPPVQPKGLRTRQTATVARAEQTGEEDETLSPTRPFVTRQPRRQTAQERGRVSRQEAEDEPEAEGAAAPEETEDPKALRQADENGEEEVAPLRRQDDEREEAVAPLRRQEGEEDEEIAPLRRQEGEEQEEVAPLRRQEGEEGEDVAPLRRQEREDEEDVAPLRRQEKEEEPEARLKRTIARQEEVPLEDTGQIAPPRTQAELEPDAEPPSEELAGDREPSDLQALHQDVPAGPGLSPPRPAAEGETPEGRSANRPLAETLESPRPQVAHFTDGLAIPYTVPQSTGPDDSRPHVVIDQLDVLIHEPAAPADRNPPHRDRERALRARYLRRL